MILVQALALFFSLVHSIALFADQEVVGHPRVIDGDSLQIATSRIRLVGIDAPEMGQKCRIALEKQYCGELSKDHLAALIGNSRIRCEWSRLALAYRRYTDKYVLQEDIAREAGAGLWSAEFVPPWDWRKGVRLDVLGDNR